MRPAEHKNEIVGGVEALNEHLFVGPLKALRLDERQGAPSVFRGGPCLPFPAPRTAEVYVDTLCVFFRRRPPLGTVKKNAADAWLKKILDKETRVVQGYLMVVQRPTRDALLALDELQSQFNGVLSRADIAIDVIVNNPEEAQNLDGWLRRNTCLKWVRDFMHDEEHGVYFVWREGRKRSSGRDICMYGDRPSKLGRAGSILHFELRFQTARMLRSARLVRAKDLITLDPRPLIARYIDFKDFSVARAEALKLKIIRKTLADDRHRHRTRGRRDSDFVDRCRAGMPRSIRYRLDDVFKDRVQLVKKIYPKYVSRLPSIPIEDIFLLPNNLSWPTYPPCQGNDTPSF